MSTSHASGGFLLGAALHRDKQSAPVRKACKGCPVTEDQLACLGQDVEDALPLRAPREVAYLRFASVYRAPSLP